MKRQLRCVSKGRSTLILLRQPEPELLDPVARNTLWPFNSIQSSLSSVQISLSGVDKVGALEHSPEEIQAEVNGDTNVIGEECLIIPAASDRVETIEENDQAEERGCGNTKIWLERCFENQRIPVDALCLKSSMETAVCDADADPRKKGTNRVRIKDSTWNFGFLPDGCEILKPCKNLSGARGAGKVGYERNRAGDQHRPDWDTAL